MSDLTGLSRQNFTYQLYSKHESSSDIRMTMTTAQLNVLVGLASVSLFYTTVFVICLCHSMRQRRVSRKFNILMLSKTTAEAAICITYIFYAIIYHTGLLKTRNLYSSCNFVTCLIHSFLLSAMVPYSFFMILKIFGTAHPLKFHKKYYFQDYFKLGIIG